MLLCKWFIVSILVFNFELSFGIWTEDDDDKEKDNAADMSVLDDELDLTLESIYSDLYISNTGAAVGSSAV